MYSISKIFVTLFYIGYIKFIPGTIGSLVSFIILILVYNNLNLIHFIIIFVFCFIASIYLINIYQKKIKKEDPSEIVIDEFLGVYLIILFFDYFDNLNNLQFIITSFLLFRVFDILKPFPANIIDKKIKSSLGVILDDIVAGVYSIIFLMVINEFI